MIDQIFYFIMVPMVYFAFAVFILGILFKIFRIASSPKQLSTLQIFPEKKPSFLYAISDTLFLPTVRKHKPVLWVFLMFYHVAFLLLILGHIELIDEYKIIQLIPHEVFLGGGFVGLTLTIALVYFIFRRFKTPYREISVTEDYLLLILLLFVVLSGSHMDWAEKWSTYGFDMTVDDYRLYLSSVFSFKPEVPDSITGSPHYVILVLHIFFANLFLIFFPFSKIMHSFISLPLNKIRRG